MNCFKPDDDDDDVMMLTQFDYARMIFTKKKTRYLLIE